MSTQANLPEQAAAAAEVVDIDKSRAEGYGAAAEIAELCALAGKPEMGASFLASKKSVAEVRSALLAARVQEGEKQVVTTATVPETGLSGEGFGAWMARQYGKGGN